jgi:hypothetical protein
MLLIVSCMAQHTLADDDLDKNIQKLFQSLGNVPLPADHQNKIEHIGGALAAFHKAMEKDDEETRTILKQWDHYFLNVSNYSGADYLDAIKKQQVDYHKSIIAIGDIIDKAKESRTKEYSSSWVNDLIVRFEKDYIKKNREAIIWSMHAISNSDVNFETELKNLIYIETMLYGSYQKYLNNFLDFYKETLDDNAKIKLKSRKDAAESFLAIIDKISFTSMYNDTVLSKIVSENKARQLNEEVYLFLKNHPSSYTFGALRALEDLRKVTE